MTPEFTSNPQFSAWPFWVLELTPDATGIDIEKSTRDITAKITLGVPNAEFFAIPQGKRTRDAFLIREAKAKLIDPTARLLAEYWYVKPLETTDTESSLPASTWKKSLGVAFWAD